MSIIVTFENKISFRNKLYKTYCNNKIKKKIII